MVGWSVIANEAGSIQEEADGQLLQAHIVKNLIKGALQEGRVDRNKGLQTPSCHSGRPT
jgi:hypothetical protein